MIASKVGGKGNGNPPCHMHPTLTAMHAHQLPYSMPKDLSLTMITTEKPVLPNAEKHKLGFSLQQTSFPLSPLLVATPQRSKA